MCLRMDMNTESQVPSSDLELKLQAIVGHLILVLGAKHRPSRKAAERSVQPSVDDVLVIVT